MFINEQYVDAGDYNFNEAMVDLSFHIDEEMYFYLVGAYAIID